MSLVRALTAALVVVAAELGGCAVTSNETTFDEALVRDVGTGSVAVRRIETTLTDALKINEGLFTDPTVEQAMEKLLRGQLAGLSIEESS